MTTKLRLEWLLSATFVTPKPKMWKVSQYFYSVKHIFQISTSVSSLKIFFFNLNYNFYKLRNQRLYLTNTLNSFPEIPESISHCSKLEILDLSYNSINYLPDSIGFLQNLSRLSLNCANLLHLPRSMGNLRRPSSQLYAKNGYHSYLWRLEKKSLIFK